MRVLVVEVALRFGIFTSFQSRYLQTLQPKEPKKTSTKPNDSYDISHEPSKWRKDFAMEDGSHESFKSLAVFDKNAQVGSICRA